MAGKGTRLQPIAFSKELYPVAHKNRHFAVSEFSIRAMLRAKVDEIKIVTRPEKMDIVTYYSQYEAPLSFYFHIPPTPYSLPESSLYPLAGLNDDDLCLFGLPDTLFSPADSYVQIRNALELGSDLVLGLYQVEDAGKYDSVALEPNGKVNGVLVKKHPPLSNWVWGTWGANVKTLKKLKCLIDKQKNQNERLLGVGFNQLAKDKAVSMKGLKLGSNYFDIGTMDAVVKVQQVIEHFEF